MKNNKTRKYSNGKVTVVWKPDLCIHAGNCVRGLPEVFKPNEQPWINTENASTEKLVAQVKECPSGALSFIMNDGTESTEAPNQDAGRIVELMKNGPLLVHGKLNIKGPDGIEIKDSKVTAFCRCGASGNKPYCDGMHKKIAWEE